MTDLHTVYVEYVMHYHYELWSKSASWASRDTNSEKLLATPMPQSKCDSH